MALKDLIYKIKYDVDDKDLKSVKRNVDGAEKEVKSLGNEFKKVNNQTKKLDVNTQKVNKGFSVLKGILASKAISVGIGLIGKGIRSAKDLTLDLVQTASNAQESIGKFEIVFGDLSDATFKWIDDTSEQIKRGRGDLREYLADTQTLFFGYTDQSEEMRAVTADMSKTMVRFALDLAAMNDVADDEAINSMTSGLMGNHLALKRLGIALNESTLSQTMYNLGIKGNFKDLDELTKIQVRYVTALEQSQTAIGHAEKESDTYASKVKELQGVQRDLKEELGKELIPVAIDFMNILIDNKDTVRDLGQMFVNFVSREGKKLADWFKDTENIRKFKENVMDVAGAVESIAGAIVKVGNSLGWLNNKWADYKSKMVARQERVKDASLFERMVTGVKPIPDEVLEAPKAAKRVPGFKNGTMRTPDMFLAGEQGPELITGAPNMRVFNNRETKDIFNNVTNRTERSKVVNSINLNVPVNVNNNKKVVNREMRQEIENFFGELLVKYGFVDI